MKRSMLSATLVAFTLMMIAANIGNARTLSATCTGAKVCKACKN
jgi:hypothetical protein